MQSLRSLLNKAKKRVGKTAAAVKGWAKKPKIDWLNLANVFTVAAFTIGIIALLSLIWLYVRPIKLSDIKVPVATDQASYYPGEEISGIFFGEIYYEGEVQVLREVFCKGYKNIIEPPASARNGDFYDTQSIPRKIEGLTVTIGHLPENIPVGLNCVLQFTNVYRIQTPFGIRQETYQYYTQNFAIVTIERRQQLECESAGRKDCDIAENQSEPAQDDQTTQSSPDSPEPSNANTPAPQQNIYNYDNSSTQINETPAHQPQEPAPRYETRCAIDFIVRFGCRQVEVN